jgi:hypothetical protein
MTTSIEQLDEVRFIGSYQDQLQSKHSVPVKLVNTGKLDQNANSSLVERLDSIILN